MDAETPAGPLDPERGYQLLIDAVQDYAILVLDPHGIITGWNSGAQRLKGYSADEILGKHISVFYPEDDVRSGKVEHELAEAQRVGRFEDESWRIRKDGSRFWANVIIIPLVDDTGRLVGFGKVTRDMSERRRMELDLEEAREAQAAASRAKDEFLSTMSHELRTPLNSVLGFAQLLELERLTSEQHELVGYVAKAGHHLLDLIDEILDISIIESGKIALSIEAVSVTEVIAGSVALVQPLAKKRSIRLTAESGHGLYILVDRQRIQQVLLNLLSNAIKYNVANGEVVVTCVKSPSGQLWIRVADTGRGISEEMMGRLFRPFDRLDATTGEIEGTGLGLALSRGLVEAMHGQLTAVSVVGKGTTFTVELPLTQAPFDRIEQQAPDMQGPLEAVPSAQAFVVYIEDNLSNVQLVQRILNRRPNVTLIPVMQGSLGVELVLEHRPTLVLLDLHLPDISGQEVLRQLKANPDTARIPVVVMSADATAGSETRLIEAGAADFVTKPINVERFLATIDRWSSPADDDG